ncbi:MAG: MFS transporter [Candidatus Methanomethylophilus sp.]|nr:MFS transporter [Methanomethylophilus sp.]MDD4221825.1 MFS transporter [Methanomethylophilus sp.]MDD4668499.1 MFS transporter [Methanomethylophilus sp.]
MDGTGYTEKQQSILLAATCTGSIINPLLSTMMNLSLVSIGDEFGVGSRFLALVNTVFFLASVVCMVPLARWASISGLKKVFRLGTALIAVAALAAAFSPSFWFLLAMRFVMGAASAAVVSTAVTMIIEVFPIHRRGWAVGMNTMVAYLGLALGPVIGGTLSDLIGWRAMLGVIAPFALFSLAMSAHFPAEIRLTPGERMDYKGTALWCAAILLSMSGLVGITDIWGLPVLVLGLLVLFIACRYLLRTPQPVLQVAMFKGKLFRRSCIATFLNYGGTYSVSFFLALYLQSIGELSATAAGFILLIQPLIQSLLTPRFGALFDRIRDRRILPTLGMAVFCLGLLQFQFLTVTYSLAQVVLILVTLGVATGIFAAPNTTTVLTAVPHQYQGESSGTLAVVRQAGIMFSMALAMACIAVIMGSADNLNPATWGEFVDVIHLDYAIAFALCLVGTVLSWARGNQSSADR